MAGMEPLTSRAPCAGAAAVGKAGALAAGVVFSQVSQRWQFGLSGVCSLAGAALTALLVPDITGLDLKQGDERWEALLEGRPYGGEVSTLWWGVSC